MREKKSEGGLRDNLPDSARLIERPSNKGGFEQILGA